MTTKTVQNHLTLLKEKLGIHEPAELVHAAAELARENPHAALAGAFAVGFLLAPVFYRVSRSATLSVANSQYVEAAILSGASTWWIVRKHVWAKVAPPIAMPLRYHW